MSSEDALRFGSRLRQAREELGLSVRDVVRLYHGSSSQIHDFEKGRKVPIRTTAQRIDDALGLNGELVGTLYPAPKTHPNADGGSASTAPDSASALAIPLDRRHLLVDLGVLSMVAPLARTEAIRHGLTDVLGGADEWEEITDEYGRSFYETPPADLLRDLMADLDVLTRQLVGTAPGTRRRLCRVSGKLAAICAMAWASAGELRHTRRWWRTAQRATDRSGDLSTQTWVRGWEVANGLYERRPIPTILDQAAQATALAGGHVSAGTAGLYAGLAQTLAIAGREREALGALARVSDITAALPTTVVDDEESMFGWPEVRLRHTESYVYTALGHTRQAYAAQDRALGLYPEALARERAAMLLHRATCMIREGDVSGGIAYAGRVLDDLPTAHHTELVYAVGRTTLTAVPDQERRRQPARELEARLVLSPAPSEGSRIWSGTDT